MSQTERQMIGRVTAIILLSFLAQAHAKEFMDEFIDKLTDRLFDRALMTVSLDNADLDGVTLEKAGTLRLPKLASTTSALPMRPFSTSSYPHPLGQSQTYPNAISSQGKPAPYFGPSPAQTLIPGAAVSTIAAAEGFAADEKAKIISIFGREVMDSRGNPTVEAELTTGYGTFTAIVPSGASTGAYEALELRDGGDRYGGKGVAKAVENVNTLIATELKGKDARLQKELDELMVQKIDGSENEWGYSKSKLGANAILAVSMCLARAGAAAFGLELYEYVAEMKAVNGDPAGVDVARAQGRTYKMPVPMMNVINGGVHAGNVLPMQEFMIAPTGAKNFRSAMQIGAEVYASLRGVVKKKYGKDAVAVGDEGGFAPNIQDSDSATTALTGLMEAIENAGHKSEVKLAMDVAASEFFSKDSGTYNLGFKIDDAPADLVKTRPQMIDFYKSINEKFPIVSIEDPFDEDDWEAWSELTKDIGSGTQIVGDDLLVTNCKRIDVCKEKKAANAMLLKINQIGTITESIQAYSSSTGEGWGVMVSHRSGETEDAFIADLVVGLGTGQIKSGAPCRSERVCKYNRLMRIEERLGEKATYAGADFRKS